MILSPQELALAFLAITLGATLQASTGLGAGLVIVPLLALLRPDLVPGSLLFASLVLSSLMALRGRKHINFKHVHLIWVGLCSGALAGAVLLSKIPVGLLGSFFGCLILCAVVISLCGVRIPLSGPSALLAGSLAALMGSTGGMGISVLGFLYQYEDSKGLRATLGFLSFSATLVILAALVVFGKFDRHEAVLGVQLIPGFIFGYVISGKLLTFAQPRYCRGAVLLIATVGAASLILRSLS
jgi:hypothetical protein